MKIGILTGGGDCPGLNAVIRAVVTKGEEYGYTFVGIKDGWRGLLTGETKKLNSNIVENILHIGGTILGTSRTNPLKEASDEKTLLENIKKLNIDALVCIGGDDTLGVAAKLNDRGVKAVGVPKTIDNDLFGTDTTFGFDTAVEIVTENLDRLRTTTESHSRVMVVEVMGRHAGWIAAYGGLAGGAQMILVPEVKVSMEDITSVIEKRKSEGKNFSIIVVSEGAVLKESKDFVKQSEDVDAFGNVRLGGISETVAKEIEKRTGIETRSVVLGHIQRGGSPTARDRVLATQFGVRAIELIHENKFGRMSALHGSKITDVTLKEATEKTKTLDLELLKTASVFFK